MIDWKTIKMHFNIQLYICKPINKENVEITFEI